MRHQGGLTGLDTMIYYKDLNNRTLLTALLEKQYLDWDPTVENRQVYHAISRGLYVAEIVRRVDPKHRLYSEFIADEIAKPLGIELYIQLPESKIDNLWERNMKARKNGMIPFISRSLLQLLVSSFLNF